VRPDGVIEVIVIVNAPTGASEETRKINAATLLAIEK